MTAAELSKVIRPIRFTLDEANAAVKEWRFNCGPGALCAILNMTPAEIRPLMGDFEQKGYTNPTLMRDILDRSGKPYRSTFRSDWPGALIPNLRHGLVRIQWGGPWTKEGIPMQARYRHTHWIGVRDDKLGVFDVNAVCVGGWMAYKEWSEALVPWLCKEAVPKWDGRFWPTHGIEVEP